MGTGQEAYRSGRVTVPAARIYWEASGNPAGIPVLYLHGGPGSSLGSGSYRSLYDPARFYTVGLDQRGCGHSTPPAPEDLGNLSANTTQTLIADIEAVRRELGIGRWLVSGVSWGSTLAMAYSLQHPDRVLGIALAAVTTTGREEVDWITAGVGRFCPEAWAEFAAAAKALPGERLVEAYARRLAGPDRGDALVAARHWERWEAAVAGLEPAPAGGSRFNDAQLMTFALLVTHYWSHDAFLPGNQAVLARGHELDGIPGRLIHGECDAGSPPGTARELHRRWPSSRLQVLAGEGHLGASAWAALSSAVAELGAAHRHS